MLTAIFIRLAPRWSALATAFLTLSVAFMHTAAGPWLLGTGVALFVLNVAQAALRVYVNRPRP